MTVNGTHDYQQTHTLLGHPHLMQVWSCNSRFLTQVPYFPRVEPGKKVHFSSNTDIVSGRKLIFVFGLPPMHVQITIDRSI